MPNSPAPARKVLKNGDYPTTLDPHHLKIKLLKSILFLSGSRTFPRGAGIDADPAHAMRWRDAGIAGVSERVAEGFLCERPAVLPTDEGKVAARPGLQDFVEGRQNRNPDRHLLEPGAKLAEQSWKIRSRRGDQPNPETHQLSLARPGVCSRWVFAVGLVIPSAAAVSARVRPPNRMASTLVSAGVRPKAAARASAPSRASGGAPTIRREDPPSVRTAYFIFFAIVAGAQPRHRYVSPPRACAPTRMPWPRNRAWRGCGWCA
jgi:hypothetical protein